MRRRRRVLPVVVLTAVVASAIAWRAWPGRPAAGSDLDARFAAITVGMSRLEVEGVLGPPADAADDTVRRVAGFRAVDHPGLDRTPRPLPVRVWWHDGHQRCLYVEFSGNAVWRGVLFAPGWSRNLGG